MPRALCLACRDHPAALPTAVCAACLAQSRRDLAALPEWHGALLEAPKAGFGRRGKGAENPLPLSDRAGDIRDAIKAILVSWVRLVHEETPKPECTCLAGALGDPHEEHCMLEMTAELDWPDDTVTAVAEWLAENDGYLLAHEDIAGDYVQEVRDLVRQAERAAAPGRSDLVFIGTCPNVEAGRVCGGRVVVNPATRDGWCTACGDRGDLRWWQSRLPVADEWLPMGRLVSHLAIAHGLSVRPATVRQWASRGLPGQPGQQLRTRASGREVLYHVADTVAAARVGGGVVAGQDGVRLSSVTGSA